MYIEESGENLKFIEMHSGNETLAKVVLYWL